MKAKWVIGGATVLLIAMATGWYFASPGMALSGLREASLAGDEQELRERVDFPKVRESFKEGIRGQMARKMVAQSNSDANGFEMLGSMLAMGMVDSMVDGLITPEGMAAMVKRGHFQKPTDAAASKGEAPVEWTIERDGLDHFTAAPAVADDKAPRLNFTRDGLGWRLETVDMPDGLFEGAP